MEVRILKSFSGPDIKWNSGEVYDLPTPTAERLVERGMAEKIKTRRKRKKSGKTKLQKVGSEPTSGDAE